MRQPGVPATATAPSGEVISLHLSPHTPTGYRGVSLHTTPGRAKPYVARLGPSAVDHLGYYPTALDAAVAFALQSIAGIKNL